MYNCKIFDYGSETQFRFYKKVIQSSGEKDSDIKEEIEENKKQKKDIEKLIKDDDVKEVDTERSLLSSQNRTIGELYKYTRSNVWEYFVTLTFNNSVDRYNFYDCTSSMKLFINRIKKSNPDMKYVLVPELHDDGAFHFHGLFSNIPNIHMVDSGVYSYGKYTFKKENIPEGLEGKCRLIYNMGKYNYGYSDIQKVESSERAASYLIKYITKELVSSTKGKKRYWNSRNLSLPKVTEHLLTEQDKKDLKTLIKDDVIFEKMIDIKVGCYENTIEYYETRKGD